MENKVILFDIDYTLFDVGKFRNLVFAMFQQLLPEVQDVMAIAMQSYDEIRESGWFEASRFTKQFLSHIETDVSPKVFKDVWSDTALLEAALYPEAEEILEQLDNDGFTLGIFSSGTNAFQKSKIVTVARFFEEEHIHIHEMKDEKLPDIVRKYSGKQVMLVDDYIPVIEKAKQADPGMTTVWMKRGRLSEKVAPSQEFPPDYIVEDLRELLPIVEN